jgi:hypothetical protein
MRHSGSRLHVKIGHEAFGALQASDQFKRVNVLGIDALATAGTSIGACWGAAETSSKPVQRKTRALDNNMVARTKRRSIDVTPSWMNMVIRPIVYLV